MFLSCFGSGAHSVLKVKNVLSIHILAMSKLCLKIIVHWSSQWRETLPSAVWSLLFVPVPCLSRWIFMLLLFFLWFTWLARAAETPQTHLREARETYLKKHAEIFRASGTWKRTTGSERWKEDKHRQNSPCMYKRFYISLSSIIHGQERLCEIFTMKSIGRSDVCVFLWEQEKQPPSGLTHCTTISRS